MKYHNAVSSQYYTSESINGRIKPRVYPPTPCSYISNAVSSQYYTSESYTGYILLPHARTLVMPYQAGTIASDNASYTGNAVSSQYYLASNIAVILYQAMYYTSDNSRIKPVTIQRVMYRYILLPMLVNDNAVSSQYYTSELYTGYILYTPCSYKVMPYQAGTILASLCTGNAVSSQYYTSENAVSSPYYIASYIYRVYPTTPWSYIINAVSSQYYNSESYTGYTLLPYARIK
ncbi:hypothetical protein DPMN_129065 [Dreissena polymorpha]|uniref:Uncharacterized protein n=1 Tax=Dreissena polymorpha TaxID=45954 RepID=A0A9D4JX08_DREPO|nr:hypothetical protein DPMN_129065 [Dreissena polymorpha]